MSTVIERKASPSQHSRKGYLRWVILWVLFIFGLGFFMIGHASYKMILLSNQVEDLGMHWMHQRHSHEQLATRFNKLLGILTDANMALPEDVNLNTPNGAINNVNDKSNSEYLTNIINKMETQLLNMGNETLMREKSNKSDERFSQLLNEMEGYKQVISQLQQDLNNLKNDKLSQEEKKVVSNTIQENSNKETSQKVEVSIELTKEELDAKLITLLDNAISTLISAKNKEGRDRLDTVLSVQEINYKMNLLLKKYPEGKSKNKSQTTSWIKSFEEFQLFIDTFKSNWFNVKERQDKKTEKFMKKEVKELLYIAKDLKESFPM